MTTRTKRERIAGLRFAHLIRQLIDDGETASSIADAIGCDISLISKWRYRGSTVPHDLTRKGLRDDVIQGIYDGLGVRSDYLFMPVPKGYPNRVRLRSGELRATEPQELDHKDFKVVTNAELEHLRDKREREKQAAELAELRSQVGTLAQQLQQVLAALGGHAGEKHGVG